MKTRLILSVMILSAIGLSSCLEENPDVVAEIAAPTSKGFYPISANTFVDLINGGTIGANRAYPSFTEIQFELQYWSDSPIQEINMYQTIGGVKEQVMNHTYSRAFSKLKSCDTLLINYTLPSATTVRLDVEILNENTFSLVRTLTIKAQ